LKSGTAPQDFLVCCHNDLESILQSALFCWEGKIEKELVELGATPKQARRGIKLCNYLKNGKNKD